MFHRKRRAALAAAALGSCTLLGCGPGAGFLGLQDYGRDILFSIGGRLATAALLGALNPNAGDPQTEQPAPGAPGAAGPAVFSIQVDNFLTGTEDAELGLITTPVDQPELFEGSDPIAFTAAIPSNYDGTSPLALRVRLFRSGACDGGCLILSLDTRCIRDGLTEPGCVGGVAADCSDGTRFVRVEPGCTPGDSDQHFMVVDLPMGSAGLDYEIAPGDFLAFELSAVRGDGGQYSVLGAEVATGQIPLRGEIFFAGDSVPEACQ